MTGPDLTSATDPSNQPPCTPADCPEQGKNKLIQTLFDLLIKFDQNNFSNLIVV